MTTELLTRQEVAARLRISVSALDSGGCGTATLPQVRIGRQVRYRLVDVERFIAACVRLPFTPVLPKPALRRHKFKVA